MEQSQNFSEKVSELLKEKNAMECPVCHEENSTVLNGIFARPVKGSVAIPCAVVVCKNCGFIREHAVDPLGIKVVSSHEKATSGNV